MQSLKQANTAAGQMPLCGKTARAALPGASIPRAGLYAVALDYCPIEGKGSLLTPALK
ncbi:MAG: hypothetical protein ACLR56_13545 [Oscillospiraceae bacterium]